MKDNISHRDIEHNSNKYFKMLLNGLDNDGVKYNKELAQEIIDNNDGVVSEKPDLERAKRMLYIDINVELLKSEVVPKVSRLCLIPEVEVEKLYDEMWAKWDFLN